MKRLKKVVDFYVFSNIHVALAGLFLTQITLAKFGKNLWYPSIFVALSIFLSYNFIRFYEVKKERLSWFQNWFRKHKNKLLIICLLVILVMLFFVLKIGFRLSSYVILSASFLVTFFYVVPVFKNGSIEFSIRNFPTIKIFSIALIWAIVSVFFPLLEAEIPINLNVYLEFFQRFLFVISITLPFDIRDVYQDDENLNTIPQLLGVQKTKYIGLLLLFICCVLEVIQNFLIGNFEVDFYIIALVTAIFLWNTTVEKSRYYTAFWVESIPIIWFLFMLLFNTFKILL